MLVPAISGNARAALMEHPIMRKAKGESSHGWLDFWVLYRTTVFLIELKHAWNAIATETVRERTQEQWRQAEEQLMGIKKDEVAGLAGDSTAVKVAMMVVPFFKSSTDQNKLKEFVLSTEEAKKGLNDLLSGLSPKPNWSCLWHLPQRFQEPELYSEGHYEIYPCLALVVRAKNVQ